MVFKRLQDAHLKLKPTKCRLIHHAMTYLSYQVSEDEIVANPSKIEVVKKFQMHTDAMKVRSFISLASYYRRFMLGFAKIARPLHTLTKKNEKFMRINDCQRAFEQLIDVLVTVPVLAYPDFRNSFCLKTCRCVRRAVLSQEQTDGIMRPITYASRSLQGVEARCSVTELEVLVGVKYLYSTIATDHQPLKSLLNTPQPSEKVAQWGLVLQELDVTIVY